MRIEKINENKMEVVATDSYRLAKKTITLDETYPENIDITIPGKNINEFDKVMNDDEDATLVNSSSRFWDAFGIKEISGVISFNKKAVCLILVFMLCYFFGYAGRFEYIIVSFMLRNCN